MIDSRDISDLPDINTEKARRGLAVLCAFLATQQSSPEITYALDLARDVARAVDAIDGKRRT